MADSIAESDRSSEVSNEEQPKLTSIKEKVLPEIMKGREAGFFFSKGKEIDLTPIEQEAVQGAADVYKARMVEEAEVFKRDTTNKNPKFVGNIAVVRQVANPERLMVNFVTTAHENNTDGRQWLTSMVIDTNPNLDDPPPISATDAVLVKKEGEEGFAILGNVGEVGKRYSGGVSEGLKTDGYRYVIKVSIADRDRYMDSRLNLLDSSSKTLPS